MAVRKTESRLPAGMQANDLGQAVTNGGVALVSYLTAPLASTRQQTYVLFVTDTALHPQITGYSWTFTLNGTPTPIQSTTGLQTFTPTVEGTLQIDVQAQDNGGTAVASASLTQQVGPLNPELESLIANTDANAPIAGHPDTTRELINDLRLWIDGQLPPGDTEDGRLNRLILAISYAESLHVPPLRREVHLDRISDLLEAGRFDELVSEAEEGLGVCQLRPRLLAMSLENNGQSLIPWTLLPADTAERVAALNPIYTAFNGLSQEDKIDIFNRLRFPKTNVLMCQTMLQKVRQQLFGGQAWSVLLADQTLAGQLLRHFNEGPLQP